MRIGLIIYGSIRNLSGGFLYDRILVNHLRASGDRLFLFSLPWRSYPLHLLDNLRENLVKQIRQAKLDLLLQDELNHPSLVLLNRRLTKIVDCPMVSIVHHLRCRERRWALPNALYRAVERAYLQTLDGFIFNNCYTRDAVFGLIGRTRPHVVATPGGDRLGVLADQRTITERCKQPGPLKLLFIGNIIPRKGLKDVIVALERLQHTPWCLNVVGSSDVDSKYTALIQRCIQNAGLTGKITFYGMVDDQILKQLLVSCHLVTMPFSYEGFGIVFLEGMAFGLPALACRRGGAKEIVRHGESGYLFAPGDVAQLADVIGRLSHNRDELQKLSLAARRRFDAFPRWRDTGRKIRGFLEEMVSRGTP